MHQGNDWFTCYRYYDNAERENDQEFVHTAFFLQCIDEVCCDFGHTGLPFLCWFPKKIFRKFQMSLCIHAIPCKSFGVLKTFFSHCLIDTGYQYAQAGTRIWKETRRSAPVWTGSAFKMAFFLNFSSFTCLV